MTGCKRLQLLSVNCNTKDVGQWSRKINEQSMKDKSYRSKNLKIVPFTAIETNQAMDYFIAGPWRERDMAESAKITQNIFDMLNDVFSGKGHLKGIFSL